MPDLPLLKELTPDVPALPGWYALVGPAKLDPKVTQTLADSVNRFLDDPVMKQKLIDQFLFPILARRPTFKGAQKTRPGSGAG